ncbi:PhnB protein [Streptococcus sp. DD10]|uniref:VOC family protein n=1 Tax=Streptococcus sp. DD10 TaxID=1777878 RepID=UPI00079449CF|nr:VOC family protein [Streptococcus sp. DD10]KXT75144.1 PhnB protein [Streptococcus sp. DD10]
MVKSIEPYIVTDGCGQEAVTFYCEALGARVQSLLTWGEMDPDCPEERKHLLLNAQLDVGGIRLQISDENPDYEYQAGRNVTIALITNSIEEAQMFYRGLTINAKEIFLELQETFWSPAYANLIDQFGVMWQISTEE